MKSPLNTYSESNGIHSLATYQARILKGILGLVLSAIVLVFILFLIQLKTIDLFNTLIIVSLLEFISLSLVIYFLYFLIKLYKKKQLLAKISKSFPQLKYNGNQYVSVYAFSDSLLYDDVDFIYKGNDLFKAENWEVSNLWIKCRSKNNHKENKVFRGCFFNYKRTLAINKPIIIKPKLIGSGITIPKVLDQLMNPYFKPKMEQIEIGYPAFDQLFNIYSSDAKETSSFLSEDKMKDILSFYNNLKQILEKQSFKNKNRIFIPKFDKPLNALELSFHKDGIYLAVREQKIFSLLKESINTKHQNIIIDLIKYLDNI